MASDMYRSKLRTPKKDRNPDQGLWDTSSSSLTFDQLGFSNFPSYLASSSPSKQAPSTPKGKDIKYDSPHKSGYFLRTPSPRKAPYGSPNKRAIHGTPSPQRAGSSTDLFGNRSLLDNLPVPDWDAQFMDHFQEDFLFGIGSEDLEVFMKSPMKSPNRGQRFLSPLKGGNGLSPLKGPLLTSSPKGLGEHGPGSFNKTPAMNGRPATRQRRLFLKSPERPTLSQTQSSSTCLSTSASFTPMDNSASSLFSNESHETTMSVHNISSYLKRFDEEEQDDELPVMPPAGWMPKGGLSMRPLNGSSVPMMNGKARPAHNIKGSTTNLNRSGKYGGKQKSHNVNTQRGITTSTPVLLAPAPSAAPKKARNEPQFTLLKPQTEIINNQICLRMAPRTPPNKIKISKDFSQIQTLPSKEQLRIVRNRFRETLNKSVEQYIEKESKRKTLTKNKGQNQISDIELHNACNSIQAPPVEQQIIVQPPASLAFYGGMSIPGIPLQQVQSKKRKR